MESEILVPRSNNLVVFSSGDKAFLNIPFKCEVLEIVATKNSPLSLLIKKTQEGDNMLKNEIFSKCQEIAEYLNNLKEDYTIDEDVIKLGEPRLIDNETQIFVLSINI